MFNLWKMIQIMKRRKILVMELALAENYIDSETEKGPNSQLNL